MNPAEILPQLVELKCRNCGSQLTPANFSPQLMAARCPHCAALFAIALPDKRQAYRRPEVSLPKRFHLHRGTDALVITRRWLDSKAYFLLFFAIFWNGFLIVWHAISISQGMWIMSLFGLIHTGVGLVLIYTVLAMFLNSTVIRASADAMEVKTGPLKWKGDKQLPSAEVVQLYCMEKVTRGRNGSSSDYRVDAVLRDNRRETLIHGLPDPDQALFIEQQIEQYLGIEDHPVTGEHGR